MFKSILMNIKSHRLTVTFIIIEYIIAILLFSLGISFIQNLYRDKFDSIPKKNNQSFELLIDFKRETSYNTLYEIINKASDNLYIESNKARVAMDNKKVGYICGVIFSGDLKFKFPILKGRYFNDKETKSNEKKVVIGKNLQEKTFKINKKEYINISNEKYEVIGVIGREKSISNWDNNIYVPFKAIPEYIINDKFDINKLFVKINDESKYVYIKSLEQAILKTYANSIIQIKDLKDISIMSIIQNILEQTKESIFFIVLIMLICIINVVNLSIYWVHDRRYEISVRRAVGATDKNILFLLLIEMTSLVLFSNFIALIIHKIFEKNIQNVIFYYPINFTIVNFLSASILTFFIGILTSLIPIKKALNIRISKVI